MTKASKPWAARWTRNLLPWLLCSGCAANQMALPNDVASVSEQLPITERSSWSGALVDESFKLGRYAVSDVSREGSTTHTTRLYGETKDKVGGYSYKLSGLGESLSGKCVTEDIKRGLSLGDGLSMSDTNQSISCMCSDGRASAELFLAPQGAVQVGKLKTSSRELRASSVNATDAGNSYEPTGYRVDGSEPVGAVDIMGTGRVWLNKGLEGRERADVACVFAGLLLYKRSNARRD